MVFEKKSVLRRKKEEAERKNRILTIKIIR